MKRSLKYLAPALLLAMASPLQAQLGPSLRGAGMAGAYAGLARGYEAAAWNPALLGLDGQPQWSFALPMIDLSAAMVGPDVQDIYDTFKKGDDLNDSDRHNLLADIPSSGLDLRVNGRGILTGFSFGPLAFGFTSNAMVNGTVGRELIDLVLYTRQYGDIDPARLSEYRVGNTNARGAVFSSINGAFGHSIELPLVPFPVSFGVNGRYIIGHELQRGRIYEPRVDLDREDIDITVLSVRSKEGSGYAIDFGVAAQPVSWLTLSFAIDNLGHKMTWDDEVELRGQEFSGSELSDMSVKDLMDRFEPRPFDPTGTDLAAYELVEDLFRQSYFPRTVRAGVGLTSRRTGTSIGATYSTIKGDGDLHTGWPQYSAVGIEQRVPVLSFITARGGYATSDNGARALSAGVGLRLGGLHLTTALIKSEGHGDGVSSGNFNHARFAERMEAGTGYSLFFGLDLLTF